MIKQKLQLLRLSKNISQEFLANSLGMDISNYCRRENGKTRITKKEWIKISRILNVQLDDIFEEDENLFLISNNKDFNNDNGVKICHIPYYVLECQKKYVEILEEEISILKKRLSQID